MLLKLKNVGRLRNAEVKIDGLTVICGNNNTGKSTVGKILYCVYDSLHNLEENIRQDKIETLIPYIGYVSRLSETGSDYIEMTKYAADIVDNAGKVNDSKYIIDKLGNLSAYKVPEKEIKILSDRIVLILNTGVSDIAGNFIMRRLDSEFGQKLGNVNNAAEKASVELDIKDSVIRFHSEGTKGRLTMEKFFSLRKNLIYIDDPFIMDDINSVNNRLHVFDKYGHRNRLLAMLAKRAEQTSVEEIIGSKKLEQIISAINSISDGELVLEDKKFAYKHSGLRESLSLQSVSTGIKTFIIIKKLLQDGMLEENGIVVLDEPEVHLHPEWQIKFAEIIVLLQKAYGLNIVLTTHSMDFLSAIDFFSQKYGIEKVCSYYLTELEPHKNAYDFPCAVMNEMTNDKEKLYASISEPFLSLYRQMED